MFAIEILDVGGNTMELRDLITFINVAELGSFSKATDQLGYSQSTVPQKVTSL